MGATRGNYNNNVLTYTDTVMSEPVGSSPWFQFPLQVIDDLGGGQQIKDDFFNIQDSTSTSLWQIVKGTGGTIALQSTKACGWISIATAASASDYQCFFTQEPSFFLPPVAGYLSAWEVYLNVTEAATNASSWFAGLTSTTSGGFLSSGAPPSSYSGAVIYKTTGALAVNAQTSNSTTQHTSASAITTAVSASSLILGMSVNTNDGVTAIVTWYVSNVVSNVRTYVANGTLNLTLASLSKMYFGFGIAAGSGGTAETITLDYVQAAQGRYYI